MARRHDDSIIREQRDAVVARMPRSAARGRVRLGPRGWSCVLGKRAIVALKREGDGATPAGRFGFRRVLYRPDRMALPPTGLPVGAIKPDDGWCDAPNDRIYNRPVTLPYGASAEKMWREDGLYDVVVVLGHNDCPRVRWRGSAVFMHVWSPDRGPTAGCVALARHDLLELVAHLAPGAALVIRP